MPQPTEDLTGRRFGRLVVIARSPRKGHAYWQCFCDCGNDTTVTSSALRGGRTASCGCWRVERLIERSTKHGLMPRKGRSLTYNSWSNMMRRCTNPDHPRYPDWGGRGITVCERWRDYRNFLADMGEKPPGTTLGRIDNDGPYEPGNCQWETHAKQARNTRSIKLTPRVVRDIQRLYGEDLPIGVIAAQLKIRRHTVGTVCIVLDALAVAEPG
jgi:hypothetical protein